LRQVIQFLSLKLDCSWFNVRHSSILLHEQSENTIEVPLVSNKARLIKSAFIKNVLLISMCSYVLNSTEEINV